MTDLPRSSFSFSVCLAASLWFSQALSAQRAEPSSAASAAQPITQAPAPASAQLTAQLPASAQIQTPQKVPLPNRANEVMPKWLRVRGEFRERMEGFDGLGFDTAREDLYWLSRFRFNATATPSK